MKRKNDEKQEEDQKEDKPSKRQKTSFLSSISGWVSSLFEKEKEEQNTFFPLQHLPPELITHIGAFLPSYHYIGRKALPLVCHQFNGLFHSTTSKQKRTKESMMKSCHTLEDTLHVFSDPDLCKQFSFAELMSMAGKHPQFALRILNSKNILFPELSSLIKLGQHDLTVAQTILESSFLHNNSFHIAPFRMIQTFFSSCSNNNKLYKLKLVQLGQYHPSIAWKAFTPDLEKDLDSYDLCLLAPSSPDILQHIIKTPALFGKITPVTLSAITKNCPETAMRFFKGELALPKSVSHSADFFAKCLLSSHLEIAKEILAMDIDTLLSQLETQHHLIIILACMNEHLEIV